MRLLATAILMLALAPGSGGAEVVTVQAVIDNTLFEYAAGDSSSGIGPGLFAGRNAQNKTRRALVRFDLSPVPALAQIDSVRLVLNISSAPNDLIRTMTVHRLLRDWGEGSSSSTGGSGAPAEPGDATWLHASYPAVFWNAPGGDFESASSAETQTSGLGECSWSGPGLVADVAYWVEHGDQHHGWMIRGEESVPSTVRRFDSRERKPPTTQPRLVIHYTLDTTPVRPTTWGQLKGAYR